MDCDCQGMLDEVIWSSGLNAMSYGILFIPIIQLMFEIFNCSGKGLNGVLMRDISLECNSSEHKGNLFLSINQI